MRHAGGDGGGVDVAVDGETPALQWTLRLVSAGGAARFDPEHLAAFLERYGHIVGGAAGEIDGERVAGVALEGVVGQGVGVGACQRGSSRGGGGEAALLPPFRKATKESRASAASLMMAPEGGMATRCWGWKKEGLLVLPAE